ncbi:MAG: zinc carboxypeptidase [bacterium]|nr:zinc carboxypeptidase [bacterium]
MRIKPILLAAAGILLLGQICRAELDLSYYLPADVVYDPAIPQPSSVLGYEVGVWHVRHDQLLSYLRTLAAHSDRVTIDVTGSSHEQRNLVLLTISAPENLARSEAIREQHLRLSDPAAEPPDTAEMPVVVNLGYGVHGNEASGPNAALLVAYHLAAAQGPDIDRLLANAVILLDPCLNPDGLDRFALWAGMHRGRVLVGDPDHRQHREGWPSGRTNHYWFDLNRDWLPAQHPESQARLAAFHRWKPNVLGDFHDTLSGDTYFFQPGIPTRQNPLTPPENLKFTRELAAYHARALDRAGRLYYSEEVFDDFYYGKGSTYPDVQGTVGILFEQANVRGHVLETANGLLEFPFGIKNHFLTSLSTLAAAVDKRSELLDYQAEFFRGAPEKADGDEIRAYLFGDPHDRARNHHLLELLRRHQIEVYELAAAFDRGPLRFRPGAAYVVPTRQAQYRLVRSLFEKRIEFVDSTFYDVSTWTMPLAFGLPYVELDKKAFRPELLGKPVGTVELPEGRLEASETAYAYLFEWDGYYAPRALNRLLRAGVRTRVAKRPFSAETADGLREFGYGTIVVAVGAQNVGRDELGEILRQVVRRDAIDVFAVTSGLTPQGVDLGSPSIRPLKLPKPALVVGEGVGTSEAGEVWHLLDQRFEIALSLIEHSRLTRIDLARYTHLILVDGDYQKLPEDVVDKLRRWVRDGGVLIAVKRAAVWVNRAVRAAPEPSEVTARLEDAAAAPTEPGAPPERRPYAGYKEDVAVELISGAIFELELDTTHPLAYGYRRTTLPVFRNSKVFLEPEPNPYTTVARYSGTPLLSGYVSGENYSRLVRTPAVIADRVERGAIVRMVDNPNFRGFWYGTNKLLLNAIFFGPIIDETPDIDP